MPLPLSVLPGEYAVCQLPVTALAEALLTWAMTGAVWSVTRLSHEVSIMCEASVVPAGVGCTPGWAALQLQGPFDFNLTGVLASVLNPCGTLMWGYSPSVRTTPIAS